MCLHLTAFIKKNSWVLGDVKISLRGQLHFYKPSPYPFQISPVGKGIRQVPCSLMEPSTAASISPPKPTITAQAKHHRPLLMPPPRFSTPAASMSWLWTYLRPSGRPHSRPSRRWLTWATPYLTRTLATTVSYAEKLSVWIVICGDIVALMCVRFSKCLLRVNPVLILFRTLKTEWTQITSHKFTVVTRQPFGI